MIQYIKHQKVNSNGILNDNFIDYVVKLQKLKKDFTTSSTRYSKTVQLDKTKVLFNASGNKEIAILKLINMVRSDAKKYIEKSVIKDYNSKDIDWYYYNDFYGNLKPKGSLLKIDLTSAYWVHALNIGLISDKTQSYFLKMKGNKKELKGYRLKALGSLATVKKVVEYKNGKQSEDREDVNREFKNVYLSICDYVANTLKEVTVLYGIYSYWDCIFVQKDDNVEYKLARIEDFFKAKGFDFTVEEDEYEITRSKHAPFLKTSSVQFYPIKKDDIIY